MVAIQTQQFSRMYLIPLSHNSNNTGSSVLNMMKSRRRLFSHSSLVTAAALHALWSNHYLQNHRQISTLIGHSDRALIVFVYIWRFWNAKTAYANFKVFFKVHHQMEQNKTSSIAPYLLHYKEYFWSYDEKCHIFSYYCLCFSATLIANISN